MCSLYGNIVLCATISLHEWPGATRSRQNWSHRASGSSFLDCYSWSDSDLWFLFLVYSRHTQPIDAVVIIRIPIVKIIICIMLYASIICQAETWVQVLVFKKDVYHSTAWFCRENLAADSNVQYALLRNRIEFDLIATPTSIILSVLYFRKRTHVGLKDCVRNWSYLFPLNREDG